MLSLISPDQFTEWKAHYERHPFGDLRADMRMALLARAIATALGVPDTITTDDLFLCPITPHTDDDDEDESNVITGAELKRRFRVQP